MKNETKTGRERKNKTKTRQRCRYPGASYKNLRNMMQNWERCSLIPATQPWRYYVAYRNMPSSCINLRVNPKKMPRQQEVTQKCQTIAAWCPKMGGNYSRNKPAGRSDQLQIILFTSTKHRLIWGSDTNFPEASPRAFFLYLLLNTKETSAGETLMKDGFYSDPSLCTFPITQALQFWHISPSNHRPCLQLYSRSEKQKVKK